MKHFLLCVWMMCTLAVGGSLQMTAQTTAYGCISSESNGCKMVSFDLESMSTESVTAVNQLFELPSELEGVSCGVSVGKKYYAIYTDADTYEQIFASFNFTTGEVVKVQTFGEGTENFLDMAYDEKNDKLYLLCYAMEFDEDGRAKHITKVEEIDPANGKCVVKTRLSGVWCGIEVNDKGGFYLVQRKQVSFNYYPQLFTMTADFDEPVALIEQKTLSFNFTYTNSAVLKGDHLYYICGTKAFVFNLTDKSITTLGTLAGQFSGLTFTLSSENGDGSAYGQNQEKKSTRRLVSKTYFGDSMGNVSNDKDMKRNNYYYNVDGTLVRVIEMGRGYGDNDEYTMSYYTKNDLDSKGNVVKSCRYQYGLYDHGDMAIKEASSEEYTYDVNGKLSSMTSASSVYSYEYDAEGNMVKETVARTATGDVVQVIEYSDFVGLDKPQTVVSSSPNHPEWTGYIYKEQRTYDAEGQLIKAVRSSVSDGKETPTQLETWTYEGNFLTEYVKSSYDALSQVKPIFKTSYSMVDGNPDKVMHSDSTYFEKKWYLTSGSICVDEYKEFDKMDDKCAMNIAVSADNEQMNTTNILMDVPALAYEAECGLRIFRNGLLIAETSALDLLQENGGFGMPALLYTDSALTNGTYDYFVQVCKEVNDEQNATVYDGYYVSNAAEVTYALTLPAVSNVALTAGRKEKTGDYVGTISWENPKNAAEYGFISNDLYYDNMQLPEADTTDIAAAQIEGVFYFKNTNVYILSRYKYGKAYSDTITVALADVKEMATGIDEVTGDGNTMTFNGRELTLSKQANIVVYGMGGQLTKRVNDTRNVNLAKWGRGTYIICVEQNGKNIIYKVQVR